MRRVSGQHALIPAINFIHEAELLIALPANTNTNQDFSFEGGTAESPPIILKPASWSQDSFVSSCAPAHFRAVRVASKNLAAVRNTVALK